MMSTFFILVSPHVSSSCRFRLPQPKDTKPRPANFYGDSKWQADKGVRKLESDTFTVTVLRPPMIYGKGSKGNYPVLADCSLTGLRTCCQKPCQQGCLLSLAFFQPGLQPSIPNYPMGKFYDGYDYRHKRRECWNGVDIIRIPLMTAAASSSNRQRLPPLATGLLWKR